MALSSEDRNHLRHIFHEFADDPNNPSAMYRAICAAVAESYPTLELFDTVDGPERRPTMLLAAVHYLIIKGSNHRLSSIYTASELKVSIDSAGRAFVDFCDEYSDEIIRVMRTHTMQTNEVNRCVALLPALMEVARQSHRPLALLELGSSAGLNLLFDRYRYDYAGGPSVGSPGAQVRLSTQLRSRPPRLDSTPPQVQDVVGLDDDPIDLDDESQTQWLYACIWVGDVAREQRLDTALALARREWPDLREGNALTDVAKTVEEIDASTELCIFNSWIMGWQQEDEQARQVEVMERLAERREFWWITLEPQGAVPGVPEVADVPSDGSVLALRHMGPDISEVPRVLALVQHHGTWLDWRDADTMA